jgi:hypothetical protein
MIIITAVKQPPEGAVVAWHCPQCRATEFTVNLYAIPPGPGAYWQVELPCDRHFLGDLYDND